MIASVPAATWTRPRSWSRSGGWCPTSASTGWSRSSSGSGGATRTCGPSSPAKDRNGPGWRPWWRPTTPKSGSSCPAASTTTALLDLYRRAWAVVSASAYEGWGLTITEAAACGTPAVASPIDGHLDAIDDGHSGLLAEPGPDMEAALDMVLSNAIVRRRLEVGARQRAALLAGI